MWAKVGLLFLTAASVHVSLSPPQPEAPPKQLAGPRTFFERIVRRITLLTKSLTWLLVSLDILATLSYAARPNVVPPLCPLPPAHPSILASPTTLLVFGALLAFAGASLRVWCYQTLGRLFTFEVSIMPAHELVTTGPYAIVRHPSYTGIYFTLVGATLAIFSATSWARGCAVLLRGGALSSAAAAFWCAKCAYAMLSTWRRGPHEDEQLRQRFGAVWEKYAEDVPYRMIPFLF